MLGFKFNFRDHYTINLILNQTILNFIYKKHLPKDVWYMDHHILSFKHKTICMPINLCP